MVQTISSKTGKTSCACTGNVFELNFTSTSLTSLARSESVSRRLLGGLQRSLASASSRWLHHRSPGLFCGLDSGGRDDAWCMDCYES